MRNIKIITVGKLKEKYLTEGCKEYLKRLSAFAKVEIFELDEVKLPEKPSQSQIDLALKAEGEKILEKAKGSAIIALCIEGKEFSSPALAKKLDDLEVNGASSLAFCIGSSCGLADTVKATATLQLSFSPMTFPHQLMRLMLLEQIYRACHISNGGKYHK